MIIKKRFLLIVLAILAFAVVGTFLSTFYTRNDYAGVRTWKTSYGFPAGWIGYFATAQPLAFGPVQAQKVFWFSLGSFLLDIAFWLVVSSFIVWWLAVDT